jgi:arsenate reductase
LFKKIFIITGETSGDKIGSLVIKKLKEKNLDVQFLAIGGENIKTEKITADQLAEMKKVAGSYEALFSRVALKYRAWGLDKKELTEDDYKNYILDEYTFLKRPVIKIRSKIFIGNSKATVAAAKAEL